MRARVRETTKCIVCLRPATVFSGHVMRGREAVIAGWCDDHSVVNWTPPFYMGRIGCCGGWHSAYGCRKSEQ